VRRAVNADLVHDSMVADSQIHRFLVLHKELDPDDDELTRTRKVRRNFVAEKYKVLIDALYRAARRASSSKPRSSSRMAGAARCRPICKIIEAKTFPDREKGSLT
jgi:long-chain acyl-CoA synthetase